MDTPASPLPVFRCEPISVEIISPQKGRGVRAGRDFRKGELIERAPTLPIPREQDALIEQTVLDNYWVELSDGTGGIPLGHGIPFLNHSETPNVELVRSASPPFIEVIALRDIAAREELCFRYRSVWFKVE